MTTLSTRLGNNQRFEFVSDAYAADTFEVVRMQGFEAISRPFRFELLLVSDNARVDLEQVLQRKATLRILAPDDHRSKTPYHGILAEFDQLHHAGGYTFYRAVLVPHLWQLSLHRISEVYPEERSIRDTIEAILQAALVDTHTAGPLDFEARLTGQYRTRSFVCQYQETHLEFISRWFEREGIYYYFDHADGQDTLVFLDDKLMHPAAAQPVVYRPADELDTGLAPDSVQSFICRQKPLPRRVIVQDFNHRRASVALKAEASISDNGTGDIMLYGENFRNAEEGQRYARIRAEEIRCGGRVFSGEATAVGLRSGHFADLSRHYRDDFNGRYLITEISHEGSQAGALLAGLKTPFNDKGEEIAYRNSFVAIPAATQYRPARTTPKPRIAGTLNATVDAEGSGEFAELDAYGQYKVQFPFDYTDKAANKASARVRMATPYSGSDHGMHFPLHKGAEVLLAFSDGDPDQPVIVGAVPNSINPNLVTHNNPQQNVISTKSGNQLILDDAKQQPLISLSTKKAGDKPATSTFAVSEFSPFSGMFGGILAATKGSSDSVSFGQSNSMSFGGKNSLSFGTESSIGMSFANKVSAGASLAIGMSNDMKMNTNLIPWADTVTPFNFTLDCDVASIKFGTQKKSDTAYESYTLQAGHAKLDPKILAIKTKQQALKKWVAVTMGAHMLISTAFALAINGSTMRPNRSNDAKDKDGDKAKAQELKDRTMTDADTRRDNEKRKLEAERDAKLKPIKDKEQADIDAVNDDATLSAKEKREKIKAIQTASAAAQQPIKDEYADKIDKLDKVMQDTSFVGGWPGVLTKTAVDSAMTLAEIALLQKGMRAFANEIKAIEKANPLQSTLQLNKDGAFLTYEAQLEVGTVKKQRKVDLNDDNGITLISKDSMTSQAAYLTLHETDGMDLCFREAPGTTKRRFRITDTNGLLEYANQKLQLNSSKALLSTGTNTSLTLEENTATLKSLNKMTVSAEDAKLVLAPNDAKLAAGGSQVQVTSTSVVLKSAGPKLTLSPSGAMIDGQLIKLG